MKPRFIGLFVFSLMACGAELVPSLFVDEPEVERFKSQPMVVDVIPNVDDGVDVEIMIDGEDQGGTRVRSLSPGTDYEIEVVASMGDRSQARTVLVTTHDALPGFLAGFDVDGKSGSYLRLFDFSTSPTLDSDKTSIFVVDAAGTTRWHAFTPGKDDPIQSRNLAVRLLEDGTIAFLQDEELIFLDELGTVTGTIAAVDLGFPGWHHDFIVMQDDAFVVMSWSVVEVDDPELGQRRFAGEHLVEFDADGEVSWEWDAFDHLDTARYSADAAMGIAPPDPDSDEGLFDWTHGNAIIYDDRDDSFIVSFRHQDWLLKLDHRTGDVVWRLGKDGDFELDEGTWFFHQHSPELQADGALLLYDNANGNPDVDPEDWHSRAVMFELDEKAMVATQVWQDGLEPFLSPFAGDADRTPNDTVLITDSAAPAKEMMLRGRIREHDVDNESASSWTLTTPPGYMIYRTLPVTRLPGEAVRR